MRLCKHVKKSSAASIKYFSNDNKRDAVMFTLCLRTYQPKPIDQREHAYYPEYSITIQFFNNTNNKFLLYILQCFIRIPTMRKAVLCLLKTLKNSYRLWKVTFKNLLHGRKRTKIRKEQPKVSFLALVIIFLAAENEN